MTCPLPPERGERFDGGSSICWDPRERCHLKRSTAGVCHPDNQLRPDTPGPAAEIRSCCRLAALLDVPLTQAAHHVVPVAVTAAEQVERLRTWASGRCLNASVPGIYHRDGEASRHARRVQRGSSNN